MSRDSSNILDSYESTENALMDSFKAAALKVTTLYKDSLVQNRKAYAAGYQQALQDLYGFITSHPGQGLVPVEDLLNFARSKNAQLTYEIRGANPSVEVSMNQESPANTSTAHQRTEFFTSPASQQQPPAAAEVTAVKNTFNPFQIDPNTQFTFTVPSDATSMRPTYSDSMSLDNQDVTMDGLKRRFVTPEFTFMGRPFNINIDNGHEPPFKRVRPKRDD
ncbi:hypothetical protein BGW37DRAFT_511527 [Umbelopsis sp. PMI_123]|nr:hypothetical protein BGW37DRAFT_511527 [Umbelopsis sp. PMI_123]